MESETFTFLTIVQVKVAKSAGEEIAPIFENLSFGFRGSDDLPGVQVSEFVLDDVHPRGGQDEIEEDDISEGLATVVAKCFLSCVFEFENEDEWMDIATDLSMRLAVLDDPAEVPDWEIEVLSSGTNDW